MADFIIQPKNDDHLKLNNDAGTTILELANDESKLRLASNNISASDGTTAITTSGANVTLAGTSNNIGTVTSGTFNATLGGSVAFPTGHIIQTASGTDTGNTVINSGTYTPANLSLSITPSSSSNKIFVFFNIDNYFYKNGTDGRCNARLRRTISSTTETIINQTTTGFYIDGTGSDKNIYLRQTFMLMDTPSTTSAVTYFFEARTAGATHISVNNNGTSSGSSNIVLMEIKG